MKPFDLALITARDEKQRRLFERRLAGMGLDTWTRDWIVVADPPGPQPGSGGSTVYALAAALDRLKIDLRPGIDPETAFAGRRIVLVHCGGLSQRLPQFAALGKAFAPIEAGAEERTVVEAVLASLAGIAAAMPAGVLVACGDVLFRGSPPPDFPVRTAAAWAWPAALEQASRHGVFEWDAETGMATAALQKPPVSLLGERGHRETAPLDTGLLFLPAGLLARILLEAMEAGAGSTRGAMLTARERWQGLDLYGQLVPALVPSGDLTAVLSRFPWLRSSAGCGLRILCPSDGEFLHFGTTSELLAILRAGERDAPLLINTIAEPGAIVADRGGVLVHCRVEGRLQLGAESMVLGLELREGAVTLGARRLLFSHPVTGDDGTPRDVVAILGVDEDPKGGREAVLLDLPLQEWAGQRGLSPQELWSSDLGVAERTLWNARVFPVGTAADRCARIGWLQDPGDGSPAGSDWPRLSLAEVQQRFDGEQWWQFESEVRRKRHS